jgi:hypothetical protein
MVNGLNRSRYFFRHVNQFAQVHIDVFSAKCLATCGDADSAWRTWRAILQLGQVVFSTEFTSSFPSLSSLPHNVFARATSSRWLLFPKEPDQSVHDRNMRSKRAASANARKSRSRVRRGTPPSMQVWAISASPRRALRRFANTFARNSPDRRQ